MGTVATEQYISDFKLPEIAIEELKVQASEMAKETIVSINASSYIESVKKGDDTKTWNGYVAYLFSEYGNLTQKKACEVCDVTPQHYRNLKAENIDEWEELAKYSYNLMYDDLLEKLIGINTIQTKCQYNTLIALGIINRDFSGDSFSKMDKFFDAGKAAGYNWENGIETHEMVDFYTKLTPRERNELGCRP